MLPSTSRYDLNGDTDPALPHAQGRHVNGAAKAVEDSPYLVPVPLATQAQPPVQLQIIQPAGSQLPAGNKNRGGGLGRAGKRGKKKAGQALLAEDGGDFAIGTSAI